MSIQAKKIAFNALCTGVIAGVATNVLLGEYQTVNYYGMNVSAPIATGIGCGCGSVVSDLTSDIVIRKLNINNQVANASSLAVKAGVGGAASAGILYFGGLPASSIVTAVGVGAGSKLAGDYANDMLFDPIKGIIGPIF